MQLSVIFGWGSPGKTPDPTFLSRFGIKSRLDVDVPYSSSCLRNGLSAKQILVVGFWFVFLLGITDHQAGRESEPWDATRFLGKSFHGLIPLGNEIPVQIPDHEHPGGSRIIHCTPKHPRESRELDPRLCRILHTVCSRFPSLSFQSYFSQMLFLSFSSYWVGS